MKGLLLFLILLILASTAESRIFAPVGESGGLHARIVSSVMVDSQGILWVGSREGLFRYDGYEASVFLPDPSNPHAISDIDIRFVYEDRDGFIWVTTSSGGLNRYDPESGNFKSFRHDSGDPASIGDNSSYGVSEGPGGFLWVAHGSGLDRLDRTAGTFEHFKHDPDSPTSLSSGQAFRLHLSGNGNLWVGTREGGVNLWNPDTEDFFRYDLAALTGATVKRNDVYALFEDDDNKLWLGTGEGLVVLNLESGNARVVNLAGRESQFPVITSMQRDSANQLWLGTMTRGVLIYEIESEKWSPASTDPLGEGGNLPTGGLTSIALGAELVFVGSWGSGVYRASIQTSGFQLLNMKNAKELDNNVIAAVMATADDGLPWVGTFGGGPRRVNVEKQEVKAMPLKRHGVRESGVMSMAGPIQGRIYAATTQGLYEFSADGSQVALFEHDPGSSNGLGIGQVTSLLLADGKGLWVGMGGSGLFYFDTESQKFTPFQHQADKADSLSGDFITALLDDRGGYIWVGTRSHGLNLCQIRNWSCQRFNDTEGSQPGPGKHRVTALYRDRRNRTWVASDGGGLLLVLRDEEGGVSGFKKWGLEDGLLNERIMAIQEDLDESLWLSTRQGLSRVNTASGKVFNYIDSSGLPVTHFNTNASAADKRFIYFGSTNGLLSIPKGSLLGNRGPAEVRIASVEYTENGRQIRASSWPGEELHLPYQDTISLELTILDYAESSYEYAYRLQTSDPWQELGPKRQLVFYRLAPGHYELQVRGRNAYGNWGESTPLALEVIPPFWLATWFRALIIVSLLILTGAFLMMRQAKIKNRLNEELRLGFVREKALEERLGNDVELAVLTPRQKEILQLIAEGNSTREMAELLNVSVKTIEAHRTNLMDRLQIHDVPGLVRLAIRSRLVPLQG